MDTGKTAQIEALKGHLATLSANINAQRRESEWLAVYIETLETTKAIAELAVSNLEASI